MSRTRTLTALFAAGRLAFGVGLMARPERIASGWLGADARRAAVKVAIRGLGARDVALSVGALATLRDRDALRVWISAAILADVSDVAATVLAPRDALPAKARLGTIVLGGGSALAGTALLAGASR